MPIAALAGMWLFEERRKKMKNLKRVFIIDYGVCYLDFDKLELLNCGDGYWFVNRIIEPENPADYRENMSPYYLLLGCILQKNQNDSYDAVTLTPFRNAELRETVIERDMVTVFVPEEMTEWIGYWVDTLKKWIFVEFLHNSQKTPRIKHVFALPKPPEMVRWMHFAEAPDGTLYVVQAFHEGIPWFTESTEEEEESEKKFLPFRFLPRKRLEESEEGNTYVFDDLRIYRVNL
jgi:hypothetical protein